jgi:hypothetical protein
MHIIKRKAGGWRLFSAVLIAAASSSFLGCNTPVPILNSPAPLRVPPPGHCDSCKYDDNLTGGKIFAMYCGYCHNARALAERPFSNYQNVAVHMRVRANLTGKEYALLVAWLRRWHDVGPPSLPVEPGPKRFIFSQPMQELRKQDKDKDKDKDKEEGGKGKPPADAEKLPLPKVIEDEDKKKD